jgi:hypothetical protein
MVYDPKGRMCPVHPTMVHPCQICAEPQTVVPVHSPAPTLIAGVNWEAQSQVPYNTPMPVSEDRPPLLNLQERLGLDDHLDDPADRVLPPPPLPLI